MGLAAVVFRNLKNLALSASEDAIEVDPLTREVSFVDDEVSNQYGDTFFRSTERRLGNVGSLGHILAEISESSNPEGILRTKVLKSFSHSGDVIPFEELSALDQEIQEIRKRTEGGRSRLLDQFLNDLEELIAAARAQENPIVFV
jgi:hypothetical protein